MQRRVFGGRRAGLALVLAGCGVSRLPAEGGSSGSTQASTSAASLATSTGGGTGSSSSTGFDADTTAGDTASSSSGEPEPLVSVPGDARYALVEQAVVLDGSGSTGAVRFQWNFDDGSAPAEPSDDPVATASYAAPGRYRPVLTVFDAEGNSRAEDVTITVTLEPTHVPRHSSSIAVGQGDRVVVVSPDSDELRVVRRRGDAFESGALVSTCGRPRSVAWVDTSRVVVACQDDAVAVHDLDARTTAMVELRHGARPYGVVAVGDDAFVTLQGLGAVGRIELSGPSPVLAETLGAIDDARGIAVLPDARLAVTRWRSPSQGGRIVLLDPSTAQTQDVALQFDPQPASDTQAGGVPSYLSAPLVSPIGDRVALPSLQANEGQGTFFNGEPLTFETTLRGVVSYLDVTEGMLVERFEQRKHFDNRGFMSAGVFSSRGDYLFLAARGARAVERVDTFTGAQAGALLDVGFAPQGLVLTADDRFLLVDAFMSRQVVVYDVSDFSVLPQPVAQLAIPEGEPLDPEVALGKRLFNDAFDVRLSKDSYMACAHCHLDGEADRRTWDFTDRGEGVRNTISLLGRGGDAHGPIHWSANFDEVHDFEGDIRGPFGGFGLMDDEDFGVGTRSQSLGDPKAGVSADLDALAAYVSSLQAFPRSPHRAPDGGLTEDALAGQALFESPGLGCTTCHAGARLTDSQFVAPGEPLLHDVGTLGAASGQRLGGPLLGLDTPTLRGLWNGAPYLHDGTAQTVLEVLEAAGDTHGATTGLSATQRSQLAQYLLSLE